MCSRVSGCHNGSWKWTEPGGRAELSLAGTRLRMEGGTQLDVIQLDYVTTARAKGLYERKVVLKHALRNAALPVVTVLGLVMIGAISGTVFVERERKRESWGNAREMRTLLEQAREAQAMRIARNAASFPACRAHRG